MSFRMVKTYKFTSREKKLIILLVMLIVLRIFYALSSPYVYKYIEKRSGLEKVNEELAFYQKRFDEISRLTKYNQYYSMEAVRSILPDDKELSSFLLILEEMAAQLNIKIIFLETEDAILIQTTEPESATSKVIESLPVILAAEGSPTALPEFAQKLENIQRACEITQLEFKRKKEKNLDREIWNMNMVMNLYYYSSMKGAYND